MGNMFEIHGAKEISKALQDLSHGAKNKIVRPGLRQGAAEIRKIVKSEVLVDEKHLRRAVKSKVYTVKGKSRGVVAKIGVLSREATDENGVSIYKYANDKDGRKTLDDALNVGLKVGGNRAIGKVISVTKVKLAEFQNKLAAKTPAKRI